MEPLKQPPGYVPPTGKRAEDILAVEAELLRSEGLDPRWPRFDDHGDAGSHGTPPPES